MRITNHNSIETIAAVCTGIGGAISIIRVSGPDAFSILPTIFSSSEKVLQHPRTMVLGNLIRTDKPTLNGEKILAVTMPGPASYTGEDVFELHIHGGMINTQHALACVLESPKVRQAEAGEFTLRAFTNGKMDLTQAEAVADLIQAQSDMARETAEHHLSGVLKTKIHTLRDAFYTMLAECESQLDFPEDVPEAQSFETLIAQAKQYTANLQHIYASRKEGAIFREGIRCAIAGHPNAGKSSFMNLLVGYDRAIVSNIPGTTRDTLEETVHIRGIPVRITDTAGLRDTQDTIEKMGVGRSESALRCAEIIFWILDTTQDQAYELAEYEKYRKELPQACKMIPFWNKVDLVSPHTSNDTILEISVKDERGINAVFDRFEHMVWEFQHTEAPEVAVNARQAELLKIALDAATILPEIMEHVHEGNGLELAAVQLHSIVDALGAITGETADPDILDHIFSRFCIGK